jgi:hypothetical protein
MRAASPHVEFRILVVLRQKGPGADKEVEIPAYAAMQNQPRLGARMLDILMREFRRVNTGL